jgi:hypothetical protein
MKRKKKYRIRMALCLREIIRRFKKIKFFIGTKIYFKNCLFDKNRTEKDMKFAIEEISNADVPLIWLEKKVHKMGSQNGFTKMGSLNRFTFEKLRNRYIIIIGGKMKMNFSFQKFLFNISFHFKI